MPNNGFHSPRWFLQETMVMVYLCSRGLELPDVALIIEHKLQRPPRQLRGYHKQMEKINDREAEKGNPRLCDDGMADWNKAAVDGFLIGLTDDTDLFEELFWFDDEDVVHLDSYKNIPLDEVLDVGGMKREFFGLVRKQCWFYRKPYPYGWDRLC